MKVLKLKYLTSIQGLIKNIKIYLNLNINTHIMIHYYKNNELINSNKELFESIIRFNHYDNQYDFNMKLKVIVKIFDNNGQYSEKKIDILFKNQFLKESEYIFFK